jgi:hypothetical protein
LSGRTYRSALLIPKQPFMKFMLSSVVNRIFLVHFLILCEPGSSVSIVSDYGLEDWMIEVRSPAEKKVFFL